MTMKITRLKTARWLLSSPISCYSKKFLKPLNIQKQLRKKKKIPNYLRKQNLIFPQRSLLAEKALRDQLWPINGSHRKVDCPKYKIRTLFWQKIIEHLSTNQMDTLRDHLTQMWSVAPRLGLRSWKINFHWRRGKEMESTI